MKILLNSFIPNDRRHMKTYFRETFARPSRFNTRAVGTAVVSAAVLPRSHSDNDSNAQVLDVMKEVVTGSGIRTSKSSRSNRNNNDN